MRNSRILIRSVYIHSLHGIRVARECWKCAKMSTVKIVLHKSNVSFRARTGREQFFVLLIFKLNGNRHYCQRWNINELYFDYSLWTCVCSLKSLCFTPCFCALLRRFTPIFDWRINRCFFFRLVSWHELQADNAIDSFRVYWHTMYCGYFQNPLIGFQKNCTRLFVYSYYTKTVADRRWRRITVVQS